MGKPMMIWSSNASSQTLPWSTINKTRQDFTSNFLESALGDLQRLEEGTSFEDLVFELQGSMNLSMDPSKLGGSSGDLSRSVTVLREVVRALDMFVVPLISLVQFVLVLALVSYPQPFHLIFVHHF